MKTSITKLLNVSIILALTFVIIQSYLYYKRLTRFPCYGSQIPSDIVLMNQIFFTCTLLLLPTFLILIRYFIIKKLPPKKIRFESKQQN